MQLLLTARQMTEYDRITIESFRVPGVVLMENAGAGIVGVIKNTLGTVHRKKIDIFCGKGNNGGDGHVVARHLANRGAHVRVFLIGRKEEVRGDAAINLHIIDDMNIPITEVTDESQIEVDETADLFVDALLGTGLSGEVKGLMARIIEKINRAPVPVVAVDAPSGLNSDNGAILGCCVKADATATMACLKRGLLLYPGRAYVGELTRVDIGMPLSLLEGSDAATYLVERADIAEKLPVRPADAYKNLCGTALVIAGSTGMTGAATLSAESTLRTGAGLVYLAIPESLNPIVEEKCTEVISKPLADERSGFFTKKSLPGALELLKTVDVVALGPGLGMAEETQTLVREIAASCAAPMVIDADGLNALAAAPQLLSAKTGKRVLTPHPGELARLTGVSRDELTADLVETARHWSAAWGEVLVVKGAPTLVGTPAGVVYVNSSGNSGMATGGSGDVLTGIITGLLAQGLRPADAAVAGVYIHGAAGDIARADLGALGMIAGDIGARLPEVLLRLQEGAA